jgi:uncharacterized phage protein gp47/JayE
MPFTRPTIATIKDRIESDIKAEISSPTDFLRRSVFKIIAKVLAGAFHLTYDYLAYTKNQIFITTADAESLQVHGSEYGISKDFGTQASGTGTVGGTNGIVIAAGTQLQSSTGNIYNTTAIATIASGGATLSIQADESGSDYNENGSTTLTFISPIVGVTSSLTVSSVGITGGIDEESNDSYRARILTRKRQPPHGGAESDYEAWALEYSTTITRAWPLPEYYGVGTIGLVYVRDGEDNIFPDSTDRDALRAWIVQHTDDITGKQIGIPVTAEPGFFVIDASADTINMSIEIYPNTTAVQATITAQLEDLFLNDGGPGKTIYLSRMYEAISLSLGEERCRILSPTDDVSVATNRVHVLGDITFSDYSG